MHKPPVISTHGLSFTRTLGINEFKQVHHEVDNPEEYVPLERF